MDIEVTTVGDQLRDAIRRAAAGLMHGPAAAVEDTLQGATTLAARSRWLDLRADTAMDPRAGEMGDTMAAALARAASVWKAGDLKAVWTAIDAPPTAKACWRWDLLHGRDVTTEEEVDQAERHHARLIRDYLCTPRIAETAPGSRSLPLAVP